jgi:hypothetical protein
MSNNFVSVQWLTHGAKKPSRHYGARNKMDRQTERDISIRSLRLNCAELQIDYETRNSLQVPCFPTERKKGTSMALSEDTTCHGRNLIHFEKQKYIWAGRCVRLTTSAPSVSLSSRECRILNIFQRQRLQWPVYTDSCIFYM